MKTILAIFALFFTTGIFAQPEQCKSISRADYRANCYKTMITVEEGAQKRALNELMRVAKPARYKEIERDQRLWAMNINNACAIDNVCKAESYRDRSIYLREEIETIKRKK